MVSSSDRGLVRKWIPFRSAGSNLVYTFSPLSVWLCVRACALLLCELVPDCLTCSSSKSGSVFEASKAFNIHVGL